MAISVFLDSNIILDLLDTDRPCSTEAQIIFNEIQNGSLQAYFSESVITTTDYVISKKFNYQQRIEIIQDLLSLINIIECTNDAVTASLQIKNADIEDALLYTLAKTKNVNYFISNDKKAQNKLSTTKLPVLGSKALVKLLV